MRYASYKYNPRVTKIQQIVTESPGLTFTDLMNRTGLANGVLSHYLANMERRTILRSVRNKRNVRYFLSTHSASDDSLIISLRKETCRKILVFLLTKDRASFREIVNQVKRSPPTVSVTLSHLIDIRLIKTSLGFSKQFELCDRHHVAEMLQKIVPTEFEKLRESFADTFSYF